MRKSWIFYLITILMAAAAIAGCGPKTTSTPSPAQQTQAALFAQATITARAMLTQEAQPEPEQPTTENAPAGEPTPTNTQPASPTPTNTTQPTPTLTSAPPQPQAETIYFASNATRYYTQGTTSSAESKRYVLGAAEDQILDISISSGDLVAMSIVGADGTVLVSPMGDITNFRGVLPSTQDYYITIRTTAVSANFDLNIMIPARIEFETGEDTAEIEGAPLSDMGRQYSLYALGGQTLDVEVVPNGDFALTIYGVDGAVLMSSHNFGSTYSGTLPSDQYYIISVQAAPGVTSDYTLTVSIQ